MYEECQLCDHHARWRRPVTQSDVDSLKESLTNYRKKRRTHFLQKWTEQVLVSDSLIRTSISGMDLDKSVKILKLISHIRCHSFNRFTIRLQQTLKWMRPAFSLQLLSCIFICLL